MRALLAGEVRRAAATSTTWVLVGVGAALGGLSSVLLVALSDETGAARLGDAALQEAMHGASVGAILAVIAGCLGMAGDWRHGLATSTLLTEPRRSRLLAVRAAVHAGVGLVIGLAASAAAVTGAAIAYAADGDALPLDRSAVWLTLAGVVAAATLLGGLGVGIGAVARNPVVGVVGTAAWFFVFEPIVMGASSSVARWLPGMAATGLGRAPEPGLHAPGAAAAVLATITAIVLVTGARVLERSDVTA